MVEDKQLIGFDGETGIGMPIIFIEFHFENVRGEDLNDGSNLPTNQSVGRQVLQESNRRQEFRVHMPNYLTIRNSSSTWGGLARKSLARSVARRHLDGSALLLQ
jgi:hypothetical protein